MQMKSVPITQAVLDKIDRQRQGPMPPEIIKLKEEIEQQTQLGEKMYVLTGGMHPALIQGVVDMKLRLDGLYAKWLEEG
ncbi:hypothetical protein A2856_03915 [Candidatus Uhrbacteria bacterium RIFCSPHIGHO2_01_FULL_63_20]|uniref:Uncharacterized protein n=1 Tax=Candidatus Uhrbacteria bacterium RIFCSPHIGHO2_01_FULL_63_20 TaxID=1802385 RepID=A0A1F7TMH5_9BACT|nr:MAG: hypothetical protein A2856_03915 [Candidatus Uhrbacteria bacterium RIFCSPHIGHO2_01_FULL_63_20]